MDFDWTPEEQALREQLRGFLRDHLRPGWTHPDRDMPTEESVEEVRRFCAEMAKVGLLTSSWPSEYGGRNASAWEQTVISEELWGAGEPRGPQYMNVNWIGPALMAVGTPEQKAEHLGRISAGDAMWCQGFSEPDAGSDLAALKTSARREGDYYVVNGQKIWTSYAHAADFCFLLVRTSPDAPARRGISVLLVPMHLDGIEVREIPTLGVHHLVHEVFFRDVLVPVECRLGEENQGWNLIRTLLANERVGNARHEYIDRILDSLTDEAAAIGVDIYDPVRAEAIGKASATTAAGRALNYVAVSEAIADSPDRSTAASIYRAAMAQMEHGAAHAYLDVLGPHALLDESFGDWQLLGSTTATIAAGSLEMQLNNIAWNVLGLPKG